MDPPNSRETATGETHDYLSRMSASPSSKPMNLPVAFGARSSVGDPLGRAEDRVSTKRLLVREAQPADAPAVREYLADAPCSSSGL
jgi:hypothetical protein